MENGVLKDFLRCYNTLDNNCYNPGLAFDQDHQTINLHRVGTYLDWLVRSFDDHIKYLNYPVLIIHQRHN